MAKILHSCLLCRMIFLWGSLLTQTLLAMPDGPPESTCLTMLPNHSAPPEEPPSPYVLTSDSGCFNPGQRITLKVQDSSGEGDDFRGFFVQARRRESQPNSYGTFDTGGDYDLKTINCFGGFRNAIGHANNMNKYFKSFGWTAPTSGVTGSIVFRYTIVEDFSDFWVGLELELPQCGGPGASFVPQQSPTIPLFTNHPPPGISIIPIIPTKEPPIPGTPSHRPFQPWITPTPCDDEPGIFCEDLIPARCADSEVKKRCCESCEEILMPNRGFGFDSSSDSNSHDRSDRRKNVGDCPRGDFYPVCAQLPKIFCRQYLKECCKSCRT